MVILLSPSIHPSIIHVNERYSKNVVVFVKNWSDRDNFSDELCSVLC